MSLSNVVLTDSERPAGLEQIKTGEYLQVTVSDTGSGMDRETLDRVFEPYFTTKGPERGTGLGLAVVHGIVTRMGGAATVESQVGRGTTVNILLPVVVVDESQSDDQARPMPTGQESILFVDDNPLLTDLASRFLGRLGYQVSVFQSSEVALEYFLKNPDAFQLVITDLWMPGLTGVDLSRGIRKMRPDLPILMCTGNPENISEDEISELGISNVARKPLVLRKFAAMIREALTGKTV